ncbi:tail fiber assembly protein, partial [Pseudodesulfovibrio pelocollis]|uniref:tail fiber assembly protein n=1 Tax=Pseudodesulfovibrio pelocollis TaxID=3051432 RepID=UPI00255B1D04
ALARGLYAWDGDAGAWVEDVAAMATAIRAERDARLTASDWTVLPDSSLTGAAQDECIAYRQALRDVPSQPGFPWQGDVAAAPWPTVPGVLA